MSRIQCASRLARLATVVKSLGADALLLINGAESNFSSLSSKCSRWLIGEHGFSLDDSVFIITTASELRVYTSDPNLSALLHEMFDERVRCTVVIPTSQSNEEQDDCKLAAFVQLVSDLKKLAIPFSDSSNGSAMQLEKWPLLQAYGIEGVGRPGFFTQNFEAINASPSLLQTLHSSDVDGRSLEVLLSVDSEQLSRHWDEMTSLLGKKNPRASAPSELQISEPLSSSGPGYACLGDRTQQLPLMSDRSFNPSEAPSSDASHVVIEARNNEGSLFVSRTYFFLSQEEFNGKQGEDPFYGAYDEDPDPPPAPRAKDQDALRLMTVYEAAADAVKEALSSFSSSKSAQESRSAALKSLSSSLGILNVDSKQAIVEIVESSDGGKEASGPSLKTMIIRVSVKGIMSSRGSLLGAVAYGDTFLLPPNCPLINLTEKIPSLICFQTLESSADESRRMARLSRALTLLTSGDDDGGGNVKRLGAKREEERRRAAQQASRDEHERKKKALLSQVSASVQEEGENEESEGEGEGESTLEASKSPSDLLGRLLTLGGGEPVTLVAGNGRPSFGTLWFFAAGFIFQDSTTRRILALPLSHLETLSLTETSFLGNSLAFRGKPLLPSACGLTPACHLTSDLHLHLPLCGLTPIGRKHLSRVVLPVWSSASEVNFIRGGRDREEGSEEDSIAFPPASDLSLATLGEGGESFRRAAMEIASLKKKWSTVLMKDPDVDSIVHRIDELQIQATLHLDPLIESLLLPGSSQSIKGPMKVSLVIGAPGSPTDLVANSIKSCLKDINESSRVFVARAKPNALSNENLGGLLINHASLESALQEMKTGAYEAGVVILSCLNGTPEILRMLEGTKAVRGGSCILSSVFICVNSDLFFESPERGLVLSPIVNQLTAPGCIDAVIISHPSTPASSSKVPAWIQRTCPGVPAWIQRTCPGVPLINLPRSGAAMVLRSRGDVLSSDQGQGERSQRLLDQTELRRWISPSPTHPPRLISGPLQVARIVFTGDVDLGALSSLFETWGLENGSSSNKVPPLPLHDAFVPPLHSKEPPIFVAAIGRIGSTRALLTASRHSKLSMTILDDSSAAADLNELTLLGSHLPAPASISDAIRTCSKGGPSPVKKTVGTLTLEEKAEVAKARAFDNLPDGVCFDGTQYRDEFGDVIKSHPHLGQFLQDYCAQWNKDAEDAAIASGNRPIKIKEEETKVFFTV